MSVKTTGLDDLHARLVALQHMRKNLMGTLGTAAVREQKLLVPRKTGNLGRSIHLGAVTETTADTVASASYAADVEFGTRPHVIVPRNKKVLRFPAAGSSKTLSGRLRGGSYAFAKKVNHPGTRPQPYMVPGAQRAMQRAKIKDVVITTWNSGA